MKMQGNTNQYTGNSPTNNDGLPHFEPAEMGNSSAITNRSSTLSRHDLEPALNDIVGKLMNIKEFASDHDLKFLMFLTEMTALEALKIISDMHSSDKPKN